MDYDVDEFKRLVRTGNAVMPAFSDGELSDQQITRIHVFLKAAHTAH